MRSLLLLVLLGGCIVYNVYLLVWYGTEDIVTWGAGGIFAYQMRVYFFHFVIVAMLAFSIYFFSISVSLTSQLVLYLCKINVTYMLLNGLAAILFGWLLSRRVNKIAGYVILLLFCVMLTSNMAENLKTLSYYKMGILKYFRGFFLFPEGFLDVDEMAYADETVLFPVHFSQMLWVIFWICLNHKLLQICPEKIVHYGFWNNDTGKLLFYEKINHEKLLSIEGNRLSGMGSGGNPVYHAALCKLWGILPF